jgi:hypothetical protein
MQSRACKDRIDLLVEQSTELFAPYKLELPLAHNWNPDEPFLTGGQADDAFFADLQKPPNDISEASIVAVASEGYMLRRTDDYKSFLPRVIGLVASGDYPDAVFRTMERHGFASWPVDEQYMIFSLIREVFEHALYGGHALSIDYDMDGQMRADSSVIDFVRAAGELVPINDLLIRWLRRDDESAERLLIKSALLIATQIENVAHYDKSASDDFSIFDRTEIQIADFLLNATKIPQILKDWWIWLSTSSGYVRHVCN